MASNVIWVFLVFTLLYNFAHSFFFATYSVFLAAHQLDVMQMMLPNVVFMISWILLEIPTGSFADLFGRKKSIILGCAVTALGALVYGLSHCLWLFMLSEFIFALGGTFISGAMDAWTVDTINEKKHRGSLNNIFQKEVYWKQGGIILGSFVGAELTRINLSAPWLASSFFTILVMIFGWIFIKEEWLTGLPNQRINFRGKTIREIFFLVAKAMWDISRIGISYGFRHKSLFYMIGFAAFLNLVFQPINMYWSLLLQTQFQFKTDNLGYVFVFISLSIALGSYLSNHFLRLIRNEKIALVSSQLITMTGIILAVWASHEALPPFLWGFYLHQIGRGTFEPLKKTYLHNRIQDKNRATIISFETTIEKIGCAIGLLLGGAIAKNFSIPISWLCSGITLFLVIGIFLKIKNGE